MMGKFEGLSSQLSDRCGLPQPPSPERLQSIETVRWFAVRGHQGPDIRDLQPQGEGVGPADAFLDQGIHERRVAETDIPRRAGAIDDPVGEVGLDFGFPPGKDPHPDRVALILQRMDTSRDDGQLAVGPGVVNDPGDFWSDPVAVDVPTRAQMTDKSLLLAIIKGMPDLLGDRAERIDDRTPISSLGFAPPRLPPHVP